MQSIPVFLNMKKVDDFLRKNTDVNRTQKVRLVIYTFSGSSLDKVQLCQVSSL